jgi:hypothetical protein
MRFVRISAEICVYCKGYKKLCGLDQCPLKIRLNAVHKTMRYLMLSNSKEFFGFTPPSGVIGEKGYPEVALFYSIPPEDDESRAKAYDDPVRWWGSYSLEKIIEMRSKMISGIIRVNVNKPERLLEKEISLALISEKPVDSEMRLKNFPRLLTPIDPFDPPRGLGADAESIRIVDNPHISKSVEKILNEDLKASEAVKILYRDGVDIYRIQKIFSLGLLGRHYKKLVPTRWAITAIDAIISNMLLRKIRGYPEIQDVMFFKTSYLGNRFWILMIPGAYTFNWIEIWHPNTIYTKSSLEPIIIENSEDWHGVADYMDGGYQAARISVLEYLERIGRKASVIVVREITPEYYAPVGNWHIRESVKNALKSSPIKLGSLDEGLDLIKKDLGQKLGDLVFKKESSKMMIFRNHLNRKLDEYFKKS